MSFISLITSLLEGAARAVAASGAPSATLSVAGTKVSLSTLTSTLSTLAKENPDGALLTSLHFTSFKSFLFSQQFESDMIDVADLLGLIGLVVPAAAVAANDLRELATILTIIHSVASGLIGLGIFADLESDGRGGFVTKTWADDPRHELNPDGSFKN